MNSPGIELGLAVCVTSRRYRHANSAKALKETTGSHGQLHGSIFIRKGVTIMYRWFGVTRGEVSRSFSNGVDVNFRTSTMHNAQSQCVECRQG